MTPPRSLPSPPPTAPAAAGPPGPPASRWRVLWLPCLLLLGAMLNLTLIVAGLKEVILDRLGGTEAQAGLFFSVEMLAYILCAPLWGVVSDRLGKRKPLVVLGFLLSSPLYAAFALVTSMPLLLALRFIQGAVTVMGWSTLMALVLDFTEPGNRGRSMGLVGGALSLGVGVGAPLGGYISRSFGVTAPLWSAAALFLLLALGSLALPESRGLRRRITLGEIAANLRRTPRLAVPYLFYFVDRYTVGFFVVLFPLYLGSLGVEDPAVRGRYLGYFLLPFAFLQYFAGRLAERTGPYPPLLVGSLAYGALLCSIGVSDLADLRWVMLGLGCLAALMFPPTLVLTSQLTEPLSRGSAVGGFNLAGSLGFALGPLVGAWAYEAYGYAFAFVAAGALEIAVALGALTLLLVWRPRDPRPPSPRRSSSR